QLDAGDGPRAVDRGHHELGRRAGPTLHGEKVADLVAAAAGHHGCRVQRGVLDVVALRVRAELQRVGAAEGLSGDGDVEGAGGDGERRDQVERGPDGGRGCRVGDADRVAGHGEVQPRVEEGDTDDLPRTRWGIDGGDLELGRGVVDAALDG